MVTLYTIDCPKCNVLEKKLNNAGIEFNICKDMNLFKERGYEVFPILEVDGTIMDYKAAVTWVNEQ